MTCASCANRIQRKLSKIDGVSAEVNYATETATVDHGPDVTPERLVDTVVAAGYSADKVPESGEAVGSASQPHFLQLTLLARLVIAAVLAIPVIAVSMVPAWQFDGWQWAALAFTVPVVAICGWPFHLAAWRNLRHGAATMDTLVSMGTLAALGWSLWALFWGDAGHIGLRHEFSLTLTRDHAESAIYLETAAGVTLFLLAGRYAETRAKHQSGSALRALLHRGAKSATILVDGAAADQQLRTATKTQEIPVEDLTPGMLMLVRHGETIPTDGVVASGDAAVDEALITGESLPRSVTQDDEVVGATVVAQGRIVVRATAVGSRTRLAQLARLVTQAQSGKAPSQRLVDSVSAVFVPTVLVIAALTGLTWLLLGQPMTAAFSATVAVLIIACPCALGLATPTALLVGTGRGAQLGIVISGPEILETARNIDTIILDKTGTVTSGEMTVSEVTTAAGVRESDLIGIAARMEGDSTHPIARAIERYSEAGDGSLGFVLVSSEIKAGLGLAGVIDSATGGNRLSVLVGKSELLDTNRWLIPRELLVAASHAQKDGATVVFVGWEGSARGVIAVADQPRETSAAAITRFHSLGLTTMLVTGDNEGAAQAAAHAVGVDIVRSSMLPEDKVAEVQRLQRQGRRVAMVGDGINDAAALSAAELGIAMGSGSDVAIAASDITLMRPELGAAATAIELSRATLRTIYGNLAWAFAYNVAAIPLAALGLLNPMVAGAAMALSSVFVVLNSLRLNRFHK